MWGRISGICTSLVTTHHAKIVQRIAEVRIVEVDPERCGSCNIASASVRGIRPKILRTYVLTRLGEGTGVMIKASSDTCHLLAISERILVVAHGLGSTQRCPYFFLRIGISRPEKPIYRFSQCVPMFPMSNVQYTHRSFSTNPYYWNTMAPLCHCAPLHVFY